MLKEKLTTKLFHIYGDNVVECERFLALAHEALGGAPVHIDGPLTSCTCPSFQLSSINLLDDYKFVFFPGFGRWDTDILDTVSRAGGILREAADIVLTEVAAGQETVILSIEFCGALPAGNQAWQRSGRAYSLGRTGIPYLYIAEIGGYELGPDRQRRAPRQPNPAVPFSYVSYSLSENRIVLPVFVPSIGSDSASQDALSHVWGNSELLSIVHGTLTDGNVTEDLRTLSRKALYYVMQRASTSRRGRTLSETQWRDAYESIANGSSLVDYCTTSGRLNWSKTAYIAALTDSVKELMAYASEMAVGLTSCDLPMCIIPEARLSEFGAFCESHYPALSQNFVEWIVTDSPLVICWVMGFKPRGDDARPDRGLPPFTRMLIGPTAKLLTVVYGPAPSATWSLLEEDPRTLISQNGLWESILEISDAVLVDSATDDVNTHGYLSAHYMPSRREARDPVQSQSQALPLNIGENDVDTLIHLVFARLWVSNVFEGMCNPPGGDWSGMSLLSTDGTTEFRWLTLPRVSGGDTKRPDHVFQVFEVIDKPIVLVIESKETPRSFDNEIGPRLKAYVVNLLRSPASVERLPAGGRWSHSERTMTLDDQEMISVGAFVLLENADVDEISRSVDVDLLIGCRFSEDGRTGDIVLIPNSSVAVRLSEAICKIPPGAIQVNFSILRN